MGCIISCGLKLILQIFNIVLCVAFLAVALFGILLKYSKSVVQHLLSKVFDQFNIGEEDLRQLTRFIIDDADYIAIILVVIGLALAALCLIGCIASCCGCNMLLKIYATLLIILLVAQIIAVSMVFSDPTLLTSLIVSSLEELLKSFGDVCYGRKMPSTIWNVVMTVNPKCCGMDGWGDFEKLNKSIPAQCCNMTSDACNTKAAQNTSMPGCRDKIVKFTTDNMMTFLYMSIVAILLKAALIVVVMLAICL
ncbi:Tetraspanin-7 [Echinococcus granulosus]|uniref:Tetraspanin n=1 Tax=Echinococcus granulosus TaxID=6210 RepID=W6ULA5_ECHGR|nr:Tetraspanin-7 [Echinococcus granulosus]EUB58887.1 Tetraspanin-7 [Echinococcus granulosus]